MPVPAAGLADVGARDPQPLVLGRSGEHVAQKGPVALLQLIALAQNGARLDDARRERVADALQLAEIGNARQTCRRRNADINREPRERLRREPGQLALQAPDLTPQLDPRQPLVARSKRRGSVSLKQPGHCNRV